MANSIQMTLAEKTTALLNVLEYDDEMDEEFVERIAKKLTTGEVRFLVSLIRSTKIERERSMAQLALNVKTHKARVEFLEKLARPPEPKAPKPEKPTW